MNREGPPGTMQLEVNECYAERPLHIMAQVQRNHLPTRDLRIAVVPLDVRRLGANQGMFSIVLSVV